MIGNDSISALPRSDVKVSSSSFSELTSPNWSTRSSGCRAFTAATASLAGPSRSAASSELPVISKSTRAERPSADTAASPVIGDTTFTTYLVCLSRTAEPTTAARKRGSRIVRFLLWMKTCSVLGLSPEP